MKNSFRKLRGFALHRNDPRDGANRHHSTQLKQIAQASKDMQEMRDCYDKLLSAAATTTNSAYEFCESLGEMGTCFLERTGLSDDEESGTLLKKLGKAQFQLQKLMDGYRSHVVQTITIPSDSLLSELHTLEDMKRQCDEKRNVYEYMMMKQKEKAGVKGESFSLQQLQAAHDDYDVEATLFMFRLQSLKQGQSRSLLTQASRHHAAQLHFFKKALKSLEEVDPDVWAVTERLHIDYHFTGLDENEGEGGNDNEENDSGNNGDDPHLELSFDYRKNGTELIRGSPPAETVMEHVDKGIEGAFMYGREKKGCSQSAPLSSEKQPDSTEALVQPWVSPRNKTHTYVLPTPDRKPVVNKHSVPLPHHAEKKKPESISGDDPVPLSDDAVPLPTMSTFTPLPANSSKELRVQAFSDPMEKCTKPGYSSDFHISSSRRPQLPAGSILPNRSSFSLSSPRSSVCLSPIKIGELHELPRPPSYGRKTVRNASFGHSAPLFPSSHHGASAPLSKSASNTASPLPEPPQTLSRSFSIPTSSQRMVAFQLSQPFQSHDTASTEIFVHPP